MAKYVVMSWNTPSEDCPGDQRDPVSYLPVCDKADDPNLLALQAALRVVKGVSCHPGFWESEEGCEKWEFREKSVQTKVAALFAAMCDRLEFNIPIIKIVKLEAHGPITSTLAPTEEAAQTQAGEVGAEETASTGKRKCDEGGGSQAKRVCI